MNDDELRLLAADELRLLAALVNILNRHYVSTDAVDIAAAIMRDDRIEVRLT